MTRWIAADGCSTEPALGAKRESKCPHDLPYVSEKSLRSVGVGVGTQERALADRSGLQAVGGNVGGAACSPAPGADPSTPRRRKGLKRSEPPRDWSLARAKVDEEGGCCRVCGAPGAQAAHILGRKFDQPVSPGARTLLVLPDRIVPLCDEQIGNGCHASYDVHDLDLAPYLTVEEQAQAVLDAGSIGLALSRISGPDRALA